MAVGVLPDDEFLDALEAFYFTGVVEPITGVAIGPVVTAQNYGLAVRAAPGPLRLRVEATGYAPWTKDVVVTADGRLEVVVDLKRE